MNDAIKPVLLASAVILLFATITVHLISDESPSSETLDAISTQTENNSTLDTFPVANQDNGTVYDNMTSDIESQNESEDQIAQTEGELNQIEPAGGAMHGGLETTIPKLIGAGGIIAGSIKNAMEDYANEMAEEMPSNSQTPESESSSDSDM